jgi:hypothetical protein
VGVLIVFITIFGGITAIGAVIAIVVLINNRRKHVRKEHLSDKATQLSIEEQYRRIYGDR